MKYFRNVTDYETGEVYLISIGEHFTITDLANKLQITRRNLVELLRYLNVVWREWDEKAQRYRWRLRPEAVEKGLGYRIVSEVGCPFDVLSPDAVEMVKDALPGFLAAHPRDRRVADARAALEGFDAIRIERLDCEGKVRWVLDHFPQLTENEVSQVVGVSRQLVAKLKARRRKQIDRLEWLKRVNPNDVMRRNCFGVNFEEELQRSAQVA